MTMPGAAHLVFLVEEPSMESFLRGLLPRVIPRGVSFDAHPFGGKDDLMAKLEARLRGYASWLPANWRIFVIVDRDDDDCRLLKARMDRIAQGAGLRTGSRLRASDRVEWQLVSRIAIEELEAWYFGDWDAVRAAYPRVPKGIQRKHAYRDPDAISGGTWQAFERVMQRSGYFSAGLRKIELASEMGLRIDPSRNRSASFAALHSVLADAVA
jgi:hypothetical protein